MDKRDDLEQTQPLSPGREHTGTRGSSDRPSGVSDERDSSAIDPDREGG
jgi:hypothetical protein